MIVARTGARAAAGVICVSLLFTAARQGRAAALSVTLGYDAGAGCPGAEEFAAVVTTRLGYDPFVETAPDRVIVSIAPRGSAIDGRIEWRDAEGAWTGEQTFPAVTTDCPRLARAMAFALAVQIELLAKTKAAASPPAAAEPPRPPPAPAVAPPPSPVPAIANTPPRAAETARRGFAVGAGPAVGFGMSSAPVLLGRAFGALTWPRTSLELAVEVSLPASTRRADGAGFSQQHLFLAGAGCRAGARWTICALARAGTILMAGEDIDRPTSAVVPVIEAGARVGFVHHLSARAFLTAHADGLARVIRWTATLDKVPVWTAPRFAAIFALDAALRFP